MSDVGEIIGRLKLDASDWLAKIEEAKAEAESLKEVDPTVRIRTDGAAAAITQLEGVKVAEDRVGTSSDAAGRKLSGAAQGAVPWMGILVGSIAAVSPGVVAVGAAAVGLTGSLTGLGAAGVLAFVGIRNEMAAGTALGVQYTAMFAGLESGLSRLEQTAALGIFTGLQTGIRSLTADMPVLNSDVALLSGQLGGILATSAHTAVMAINGFTPVLTAGGAALQGFLSRIDGFTSSNGFTHFIDYTVARLPDVMHLIDSTLGAVGGIFTALAPAGQSTLFMLSSLMDLIRALAPTFGALMPTVIGLSDAIGGIALVAATLLNYLGPLGPVIVGTAAAMVGLAFASKAVAGAMVAAGEAGVTASIGIRAIGAAVDFLSGPLGLVLIAGGLLASALATMGNTAQDTSVSVTELTSALQEDNGVVGENTRALMAHAAVTSGAAAGATQLGISQRTLNSAMTGSKTAIASVNSSLDQQRAHMMLLAQQHKANAGDVYAFEKAQDAVKGSITAGNAALKTATDQYNKIAVATGHAKVSQDQLQAAANRVHMPVEAFSAAAAAQLKAADAAQKLRAGYILAGDAANLLKLDMDKLNGATISNAEAQAAWASGLDSLKSSFNSTSKAITGNSRAALENRGAVASLAATGETALQSLAGQTHSASQTTAAYRSMRGELINQVAAMGNSRAAAARLVDQYFKIPKNIKTDFQGDDRDALAKAAEAKQVAQDFARGDYKAALKADPSQANSAKADAMSKAEQFARAQYMARYQANPSNANAAAMAAAAKAHWFGNGFYMAYLRANPGPVYSAVASAQQAINSLHGRTVDLVAHYTTTGSNMATGGVRFASGGTAGVPHAAAGITAGYSGTVRGSGGAASDLAGLYALANGEEVISNLYGQADRWRPLLKAINAGKVRGPRDLAGSSQQGPTTVITRNIEPHITIQYPTTQDPVQAAQDAAQYIQAYSGI